MNEQKTLQPLVNVYQQNQSSIVMPQLHRIPDSVKTYGTNESHIIGISPEAETKYCTTKTSKDTSETLKRLVQAHKKLAINQAELSDPKVSTLPTVSYYNSKT